MCVPTIYLYFVNIVSVLNLQFNHHDLWDSKSVLYCHVRIFINDLTFYFVLYSRVCFALYGIIPYFFAIRSVFKPWFILYVYVAYPILVLRNFTLVISLSYIRSWYIPMGVFHFPVVLIKPQVFSLNWMVWGVQGILLSTRLMFQNKFDRFLYPSSR